MDSLGETRSKSPSEKCLRYERLLPGRNLTLGCVLTNLWRRFSGRKSLPVSRVILVSVGGSVGRFHRRICLSRSRFVASPDRRVNQLFLHRMACNPRKTEMITNHDIRHLSGTRNTFFTPRYGTASVRAYLELLLAGEKLLTNFLVRRLRPAGQSRKCSLSVSRSQWSSHRSGSWPATMTPRPRVR